MYKRGFSLCLGFTPLETIGRRQKANVSLTGFTLVELLICTIIIILLAAGMANIFVVGKGYILRSGSRINSAEIAKRFLAPLHSQVRQDQWSSTGNCVGNFVACPSAAENIDGVAYTPVFNITDVTGTTLRRVKVRIDWTAP